MANAYGDLATLKSPAVLNVPDGTHDIRLLGMLEVVSRWIDGYCGRQFAATLGERLFDGTGKASLTVPDLVSVNDLRVREASGEWVAWPASDWLPYPLNAAPSAPGGRPYTRIMLASGTHRRFPLNRAGVSVRGVWGYGDVREDIGLQVSGNAEVVPGDGTISTSAAGNVASVLSPGHTIRIDDEQLYVVGVVDDGQGMLTLTVQRGVNGTEAATHAVGSAVSVYRYPKGVSEACLLQTAIWWRERLGGPFRSLDADGDCSGIDGISPTVRTLLAPYRRRNAVMGV